MLLSSFSPGLEDDRSKPPHERPDASESDPPGPSVPPAVPVRPGARSGLHHVCGHPGNHLPGHRELEENRQAASGPQGIQLSLNRYMKSHLNLVFAPIQKSLNYNSQIS